MKITINGDVYSAVGQEISHDHICAASGVSPENGTVFLTVGDARQEIAPGNSVDLEDGQVFECIGH